MALAVPRRTRRVLKVRVRRVLKVRVRGVRVPRVRAHMGRARPKGGRVPDRAAIAWNARIAWGCPARAKVLPGRLRRLRKRR